MKRHLIRYPPEARLHRQWRRVGKRGDSTAAMVAAAAPSRERGGGSGGGNRVGSATAALTTMTSGFYGGDIFMVKYL